MRPAQWAAWTNAAAPLAHAETDAMHPVHLVERAHGIVLSGGSAFGLDAASGAVRYLEERGVGFDVGVARVPIGPFAILFDLGIRVRPMSAPAPKWATRPA